MRTRSFGTFSANIKHVCFLDLLQYVMELTFLRLMGGWHLLIAVSAAASALSRAGETHAKVNTSAAAHFHSFRKKFHRLYEVDSEELIRRRLYFQSHSLPGTESTSSLTSRRWNSACGSCWAFSVVGAVQSVYAIGGSQLEQLSVQQVVDCSFKNKGCDGGSPSVALTWLKQTKVKLVTQSDYPYKAKTGICHFFSRSHGGVSVKDFSLQDFSGQEEAMMGQLVQNGPLAVIVDAVSWQDYLGGIIQHHCTSQWSNHAVLVVGYDTTGEIPYWIVQNSWGTSWGNEGYVYVKIGSNVCGIAESVAAVFL
ncbi:transcript variant X2 [Nothobranchius furzeri]|uniref:Transcript variant X2 n=1 Tax=Nothobranchius furzeri TaxID=105023 RepID=A0A9D2YYX0_NOTFU|nr:cathepsin O isoform X4 [Nothobranchius furzeri]KAF7228602.1 transcript variant X2 [Nothobranchius furzeri]